MASKPTLGKAIGALVDAFTKVPTLDDLPRQIGEFRQGVDQERHHASDHLYITDFAYRPCVRRLAYYLLRPDIQDPPKPVSVLFDMDAGTMAHELFQDRVLGPMGILEGEWECSRCRAIETGKKPKSPCLQEIKILDLMSDKWKKTTCKKAGMKWKFKEQHIVLNFHGIKVTGRPDGTLVVTKNRVLEIKTTEDTKFQALDIPKDYHVFQASVYGSALGFDEVVIFYVNRNHWDQIKAYVVKVDPDAIKSIENYCDTIALLVKKKDPLRAVSTVCKKRSAVKAKECGFKDICHPLKRKRK